LAKGGEQPLGGIMLKDIKYYVSLKRKIQKLEKEKVELLDLLKGIQQSIKEGRREQINRKYEIDVEFEQWN
jgi:hypothetical protein